MTPAGPISNTVTNTRSHQQAELRKACQAFEAIMLRQVLSSARASNFGGNDIFAGPGLAQFAAMRDEHFADIASRQGMFGIAEAIERQLSAPSGTGG